MAQLISADGRPPSLEGRRIPSFGVPYTPKCLEWAFEIPIRSARLRLVFLLTRILTLFARAERVFGYGANLLRLFSKTQLEVPIHLRFA